MPAGIFTAVVLTVLLSVAALFLLNGKRDGVIQDVQSRDALLTPLELEKHAREIARTHKITKNSGRSDCLVSRMDRNFAFITSVYKMLSDDIREKKEVPPAAEWLLDNFYILEEQVKTIRQVLVRERCLKLNILESGYLKGYPRIFAVALELVSHLDGRLDQKTVSSFISAYQSQNILSMGELWALPLMLNMALIENLKNVCGKVSSTQIQWRLAEALPEGTDADCAAAIKTQTAELDRATYSFVEHLLQRMRRRGGETKDLLRVLDSRLQEFELTVDGVIQEEHQEQANRQVAMGNTFTSLRLVADMNWNDFFEELSVVEGILRDDPDGTYPRMDFSSRDHYRHAIEKLAKMVGTSETNLTRKALELAGKDPGQPRTKKSHIGFYLVGAGKDELLQGLGYRGRGEARPVSFGLYLGSIIFLTQAFTAIAVFYVMGSGGGESSLLILAGLLAILPGGEIAVTLVNRSFGSLVRPSFFPKLSFVRGIPREAATLVVMPVLLPNKERARELVEQLEVHFLANREENLFFALLGDLKDDRREVLPDDGEILAAAREGIRQLNEKYGAEGEIFFFFSRPRTWCPGEEKWMGWERKRGALSELNEFLMDGESHLDRTPGTEGLKIIRYVITLDADTRLPLHTAQKLVGTIAHPLNRPHFDSGRGIVTEGYGLIQPRISVSVDSANKSFFSRVFAGQGGIDPYTTAVSDTYQDCFGEGIFTGKGIYDVAVFRQALSGAFPDTTVLSHDLLEGSYVRVGLATDIELVDGYPTRFNGFMMRLHRWVRGDWQLILWLGRRIKDRSGKRIENPLSPLSRWKIFDNLRRSLTASGLLLLFFLGAVVFPGPPFYPFLFGLFTLCLPLLSGLLDYLFQGRFRVRGQRCHGNMIFGLRSLLAQAVLLLIFLPYQSWLMLDAVCRTLFRVLVSRKNLLQWVTAADVERTLKNDGRSFWREMILAPLTGGLLIVIVYFFRPENVFYALPLGLSWLISPAIAHGISRPDEPRGVAFEAGDGEAIVRLARKTWAYYEDFAGEDDHYLPPDNVQENPSNGVAHRTSPTNIGFLLLAILSARDLGFIGTGEMTQRLEKTLATVEGMKKWKGHLYNWYDTTTLEVLRPAYISTVDSGNFVGYLMTLKQGLLEVLSLPPGEESQELRGRMEALIRRIEKIVGETKFSPLYDRDKRLFSIGYHVEEEKLTNSYYDLLASEARITSFLAVARGEVPLEHWFRLGRSLTVVDGYRGLVSWSGTMFEYFMPYLIMKDYANTLMNETYHFVLEAQKKYGRLRGVPWGTSESGFYAFDTGLNYQYKAFGVPDLGLKRGLIDDMVVSPYSTLLALPFDPQSAMINMKKLWADGLEGDYGFFEAVDYTLGRMPAVGKKAVVKSFMAHHQGMSLIAMNNFLNDQVMQKRFHRDPLVKAAELLLQEKVPLQVIVTKEHKEPVQPFQALDKEKAEGAREFKGISPGLPACHLLANGRYSLLITDGGSGYSSREGRQVTRWRENSTVGLYGFFIFLQNTESAETWSATYEPFFQEPAEYRVIFLPDKGEFIRADGPVGTHTEVTVSPEDTLEIRRLTLTNHGDMPVTLEVTSYAEIVLAPQAADLAHPAFSNLFVKTEYLPEYDSLLAYRRPRGERETPLWAVHGVVVEGETVGGLEYETDRSKFIGRGRDLASPQALDFGRPLNNTIGAVLDPIVSLRRRVRIEAGRMIRVSFFTGVAGSRAKAQELTEKYHQGAALKRAFELALTRSQVEEDYLNLNAEESTASYGIIPHLLFISPLRRKYKEYLRQNKKGQQSLWPYGISGDLPIFLVVVKESADMDLVKNALKIHEYLSFKGLVLDLVILNGEEGSYYQTVQEQIRDLISVSHARDHQEKPGGVFLKKASVMPGEDIALLYTAARVIIRGGEGPISSQLREIPEDDMEAVRPTADQHKTDRLSEMKEPPDAHQDEDPDLAFFNGLGGFSQGGREYVIHLKKGQETPMPWINVISNRQFGFLVSESGSGFIWAENSRENKLTPWYNDPVGNFPGEALYLRDEESGDTWSLTALPLREHGSYTIHHGFGYTHFQHGSHGIDGGMTVFAAAEDPVKVSLVTLKNSGVKKRTLSLTYFLLPVLGVSPETTGATISTGFTGNQELLTAANSFNSDFPGRVIFAACSRKIQSYTGDRREFIGDRGSLRRPDAMLREKLSNRTGVGLLPCLALRTMITLEPGETLETVLLLGQGKDGLEAEKLAAAYRDPARARAALKKVTGYWEEKLGLIQVRTPDRSMDFMLNGWLLYQAVACRLWGRSALYQSGGAFGFRDQLQDSLAAVFAWPDLVREQILLHAAHQFTEGDVQHWWHPGGGDKGVRTRFSDDLLWLPFVTAEYIRMTHDLSILQEEIHFLQAEPLKEGEDERYIVPEVAAEKASLYVHCIRAVDRALKFGTHGLPLMGSGDWNDGMNCIGNQGQGESVWLGWFLYTTLQKFGPFCKNFGEEERAEYYEKAAVKIAENIEASGWDGGWYRRAYFDCGLPLGSAQNTECRIDSLTQSWAVISGAGREDRCQEAMAALENYLVKKEAGLILLLTPAFDAGDLKPGYIKGYVPGVRENGGQYTHAAVWVINAMAKMGRQDKTWALYQMINPVNHTRTPIECSTYMVEPYVMAADVYAAPPHIGRGGWTWYTGAASWMYKVGLESVLGFYQEGDRVTFHPCIPAEWPGFQISIRYGKALYRIQVRNPQGHYRGVQSIGVDGTSIAENFLILSDDGQEHQVDVLLGE